MIGKKIKKIKNMRYSVKLNIGPWAIPPKHCMKCSIEWDLYE